MGKGGKIRPQQIQKAQRLLTGLPEKERCSREKAVEMLAKDLKKAFQKGYSPKEICAFLRKDGIVIGERLLTRFLVNESGEPEVADAVLTMSEAKKGSPQIMPEKKEDVGNQDTVESGGILAGEKQDYEAGENKKMDTSITKTPVKHGKFEIIPDTPLGEL